MLRNFLASCAPVFLSCAFVVAQINVQIPAQSPEAKAATDAEAQKSQQEREQKALALLDEVITQGNALRRPENRVRVQMTAADLLWSHDEKRAHELYRNAMDTLSAQLKEVDLTDPQYHSRLQPLTQLRMELLQTLVRHDAKLALEFLRASRPPDWSAKRSPHGQYDQESQLENGLLMQIALDDPKKSVALAEEMLEKGFPYQLSELLQRIGTKDTDTASKLFGKIEAKLRTENLAANTEASFAALNLARQGIALNNAANNNQAQNDNKPAPYITPQNIRELLEMLAAAAPNISTNNSTVIIELQQMLPDVEKYAPSTVSVFRRRVREFQPNGNPDATVWNDFQKALNKESIEAALNIAAKAPEGMRDSMYQQAAWNASSKGDTETARRIINDRISNPAQRAQALAQLEQQEVWRQGQQGKINEARQAISRLRTETERAAALIRLAQETSNKGDKKTTLEILDEANNISGGRARNAPQMQIQFQLIQAYAQFNSMRGFEIIEPMTEQLNELINASLMLDGFNGSMETVREDEASLQPYYGGSAFPLYHQCINSLAALVRLDFDRAKSIADRFQRPELQTMARLTLAQITLNRQNKSSRMFYGGRRGEFPISKN